MQIAYSYFFGASDNANDLFVEKDTTVEPLKEALALIRAKGYDRTTTSHLINASGG
jgi:hypothetical protein